MKMTNSERTVTIDCQDPEHLSTFSGPSRRREKVIPLGAIGALYSVIVTGSGGLRCLFLEVGNGWVLDAEGRWRDRVTECRMTASGNALTATPHQNGVVAFNQ